MRHRCSTVLLACALLCRGAATGDWPSYAVPLYLNGANVIRFGHEHPARCERESWVLYPELSCQHVPAALDSSAVVLGVGLGSETGDPLLNAFTSHGMPNRDHQTHLMLAGRTRRPAFVAFGAYRYQDTYADRYDSLWEAYAGRTGSTAVRGLGSTTRDALVDELAAGFGYRNPSLAAISTVYQYARMGAVPLFYTPSWQKGWATSHAVTLNAGPVVAGVCLTVEQRRDYLDHQDPAEVVHTTGQAELAVHMGQGRSGTLCAAYDDALTTPSRLTLKLQDSARGPFSGSIELGADGDGRPWFGARVGSLVGRVGSASVSYRSNQRQRPADQTLYHLDTMVQCRGMSWQNTGAHAACSLGLPLRLSPSLSAWCDYDDSPGWFLLERTDSAVMSLTEVLGPGGPLVTAGGRVLWAAEWRRLAVECGAQGHVVLDGGEEALGVPWNAWATVGVHSVKAPALACNIRLDGVGPVTSRWYEDSMATLRETRVASRAEFSAQVTLPVVLPFLRERLRTALVVTADHVPLSSSNRVRQHPAGNLTGPRIQVSVESCLLPRP